MTDKNVTFVSVAAATIIVPQAAGSNAPEVYLIGAGLLIATYDGTRWRFSAESAALKAGEKEQNLLLWLSDRLPMANTVIGWNIDNRIVPALINAAAHADPTIAQHFMLRLSRALRNNVVDLAIDRSAAVEPGIADEVRTAPSMAPDVLLECWGKGQLDTLRADLRAEALGTWLAFVRQGKAPGMAAEQATRDWMHRRSSIQSVKNGPGKA